MQRSNSNRELEKILSERFGEPIQHVVEASDAEECCCSDCGMMTTFEGTCENKRCSNRLDEKAPKGYEKVVKALKKQPGIENPWAVAWSMKKKKKKGNRRQKNEIVEMRERVSPAEVEQTWEDLYINTGDVSLESLASWLGATVQAVRAALPRYLMIDKENNVVERGLSPA